MKPVSYYFVAIAVLLSAVACEQRQVGERLADLDGTPITSADVEKLFGKEIAEQRDRLYRLQSQKLEQFIGARLLTNEASKKGISVESLLEQEVFKKVSPVDDKVVEAFYDANKNRLQVDIEKVRDQIRDYLQKQRNESARTDYLKSIRANAKIVTYLKPPAPYRSQVLTNGAPTRGRDAAVVSIVKFEDFQCPYCKTVQPTFTELLKRYDGKVRVVHKDLPLDAIHPQARQAAEAARCAADQGKFWEFHDRVYAGSPKATVDDLKGFAKDVGLNESSFAACIASGKFKAAVQKDLNEGSSLGLTGTPTFFINGRELSGGQPLEAFTAIIDEELALAK